MPQKVLAIVFCLTVLVANQGSLGCLWDRDTYRDEQRGLPGISQIIAGKWEKHSPLYYETRVAAMKKRLESHPDDIAAYDDLAVAHEKLGDPDAAIKVMLEKRARHPGLYTTEANLGTFYLHTGDFDRGIAHIREALRINPDAHFGREKYQLQVAEYLYQSQADPKVLDRGSFVVQLILEAIDRDSAPASRPSGDEVEWRHEEMERIRKYYSFDSDEIDKAITGVVGMIRFGTGTSSHLYFALGDLLAAKGDKHLAYRAYKRALDFKPPRPELIQEAMEQVRRMIEDPSDISDQVILAERRDAEAWVHAYQTYEIDLIKAGKDADDEKHFEAFYAEHGPATPALPLTIRERLDRVGHAKLLGLGFTLGAVLLAIFFAISRWLRRSLFGHSKFKLAGVRDG